MFICVAGNAVLWAGYGAAVGTGYGVVKKLIIGAYIGVAYGLMIGLPASIMMGSLFGVVSVLRTPGREVWHNKPTIVVAIWAFVGVAIGALAGMAMFAYEQGTIPILGSERTEWTRLQMRALAVNVIAGAISVGSGGVILGLLRGRRPDVVVDT